MQARCTCNTHARAEHAPAQVTRQKDGPGTHAGAVARAGAAFSRWLRTSRLRACLFFTPAGTDPGVQVSLTCPCRAATGREVAAAGPTTGTSASGRRA
eukprot:8877811-Lingulodinium_polyedra.AAC.1